MWEYVLKYPVLPWYPQEVSSRNCCRHQDPQVLEPHSEAPSSAGSASMDTKGQRYTWWEKSTYKWTCAVQVVLFKGQIYMITLF